MSKDFETGTLAEFCAGLEWSAVSEPARRACLDSIFNGLGLGIGAAFRPEVEILRTWILSQGGAGVSAVGGVETAAPWAALLNAYAIHVDDYDDTHFETIIHPTAPVLPAVLSVGQRAGADGPRVLAAFVAGVEAAFRVGLSVFPSHYDRGFHITSTAGGIGAAVGAGRVLGLSAARMEEAIGLASTLVAGSKGTFGSMAKPLNPGHAAWGGVMAAELAAAGMTSGRTGLASPLGFSRLYADELDADHLTRGLGEDWLICHNVLKPFACGVVAHPAIDGMIRLRDEGLRPADVRTAELRVHPRVEELTGNPEPDSGLAGKFSVQHSVAAALFDGRAGPRQYTDDRVGDPEVVSLRKRVTLTVDSSLALHQAEVRVETRDRKERRVWVDPCLGSVNNPMSARQLEDKVADLLADRPGLDAAGLLARVHALPEAADLNSLCEYLGSG